MQLLVICGNVGKDAVLRKSDDKDPVLNWTLAVDNGKTKDGEKRKPTWYDCSMWGKRAEALDGYIKKGTKLSLRGRPTAREYEGKAYLGIQVDELTFMGGGERSDSDEPPAKRDSAPAASDDDIPF